MLPHLMELMMKPENMQTHNLKVIRIYYAVEELIGVLGTCVGGSTIRETILFFPDEEHQGSIPEVLRVLFHVHESTKNTQVRELVLAVYPAIGRDSCRWFRIYSFFLFSNGDEREVCSVSRTSDHSNVAEFESETHYRDTTGVLHVTAYVLDVLLMRMCN